MSVIPYQGHGLVIFTNRNSEKERHKKSCIQHVNDRVFHT